MSPLVTLLKQDKKGSKATAAEIWGWGQWLGSEQGRWESC